MNRLYVVEALYSITGAGADHHLRVRASDVRAVAAALAVAVGLPALPRRSSLGAHNTGGPT